MQCKGMWILNLCRWHLIQLYTHELLCAQVQHQAANQSALSVEDAKEKAHEASDELHQAVSAVAQTENTKLTADAQRASLTTAAGEAEAELTRMKQAAAAAVQDAQTAMEQSVERAREDSQHGIDQAEQVQSAHRQASGDAQAALQNALSDQETSEKVFFLSVSVSVPPCVNYLALNRLLAREQVLLQLQKRG